MSNLLTVIEQIEKGHNGLPETLKPGTLVFRFMGNTYGCLGPDEVGISLEGPNEYPFYGVPLNSVSSNILDALMNARAVFWACFDHETESVTWETTDGKMTPHCNFCGKTGEPR